MLFTDEIWKEWCEKVEKKNERKSYTHFDYKFDFSDRKHEIYRLVSDPNLVSSHAFLPFIKIETKTPRFRYQENEKQYGLETKVRPIAFSSHFDTYIYSFYSFALTKYYQAYIIEKDFSECVLAYRTDLNGKCNIQFAKEVFDFIKQRGECTALALDIKGYFDNIDHNLLKDKWCKVLNIDQLPDDQYKIFRSLTKYAYVNKQTLLKHFGVNQTKEDRKPPNLLEYISTGPSFREKFNVLREHKLIVSNSTHAANANGSKRYFGIPQGSSISALLSNIYLIDYDKIMSDLAKKEGWLYRRYCDDILIVCDTPRAFEMQKLAIKEIENYHLTIQDKKVEIIEFCKNSRGEIRAFNLRKLHQELPPQLNGSNEQRFYKSLQYLGFEYNGKSILVRPGSLSRYFRKMKARISRTVNMAYSDNGVGDKLFMQKLLHRYTHLGKRNFLHYVYNASKESYVNADGVRKHSMNSKAIKKQVNKHFEILMRSLRQKSEARAVYKSKAVKA